MSDLTLVPLFRVKPHKGSMPASSSGSSTAFRLYQPMHKQLTVNAPRESLLHLGAIHRPSFTFRVKISQPNWTPGVGIYLGYHETPTGGAFQYLQFTERSGPSSSDIRAPAPESSSSTSSAGIVPESAQ